MTSYQPVSFRGFGGGLNLRDKEDAVDETECIDALNVQFTTQGALTQRDGYGKFTGSELTNRAASLEPYYSSSGTKHLLAGCGTRLEAINTSGTVVGSATGLTSAIWDFARFGAPGNELAYAGNGNDTLRKWDGSSWTAPTATVDGTASSAMPKAGCLAVMAVDQGNRLVASGYATTTGGPGGATSSPSHVYFSDAGDPESWTTNNYEIFTPGDGEAIQAVVAWREFVYVFKESKFYVIYGTSTDSSGNPVFNYRTIDGGVGLASPRAVAIAPDGVYFMSRRGVYRSTGAEAELISSKIDPIFLGNASAYFNGSVLSHANITQCAMGAHEQRIYLAYPGGTSSTNNRVLVYDTTQGWWTLFDLPAAALTSFRVPDKAELLFAYATGTKDLGRHSSSYTSDAGTAITSYWRSGWFDYDLTTEKSIRETKMWGSGGCATSVSKDFELGSGTQDEIVFSTTSSVTWNTTFWGLGTWGGSSSGLEEYLNRRAHRGTTFSTYFTNNTLDRTYAIHRLAHHLRETRVPTATD